ncbi:MAG: Flp pilus assembly complex ATPase component TadA [Phycisphaerae bacterium]|nr:Flp pilus assembly complex ATPase component TadA [Phycisphaerae bacterium]
MTLLAVTDLLAQGDVPLHFTYISPWKLVGMVLGFTCWSMFAQWVDKDTIVVNTFRILWNMIAIGVGIIGTAVMLFTPFVIGLPALAVMLLANLVIYTLHRNGLVPDDDKVLTPAHIKRVMSEGFGGKKKVKEVKERVRLRAADGARCAIPDAEDERERYRLSQDLLWDVLWNRATRVEVTPGKEVSKVTYEIDGIKSEREGLPRADADAIVYFMKTISGFDLEERRKPQTDRIQAEIANLKVDVEVRTDGSVAGEKLTLRVIGEETRYKITDIGLSEKQVKRLRELMESPTGLMLISAPAGTGMTTTIYSFTRSHDAFLHNIQTLEYRRELPIDNVTQTEFVQSTEEKTFAGDLQKLFRTDPDIVVIPEVREQAAAVLVTEAAVNKQLVYAALNASDVFSALRKWMELVGDNTRIAKSLLMVSNQRLIRCLCPSCKQPYKPDPATLKKLNLPADAVLHRQPEPEFDKRGNPIICQHCQGTGYVGRTAIFDVMFVDDPLRAVIAKAKSIADVQAYAVKQGGRGFQTPAMQKVLDGTTSIQEITRVLRAGRPARPAAPKPPSKPAAS